jgi:hypothetical protein
MSCVFSRAAEMLLERGPLVQEVSCWTLGAYGTAGVDGMCAGGGLLVGAVSEVGYCWVECGAAGAAASSLRGPSLDSRHKYEFTLCGLWQIVLTALG